MRTRNFFKKIPLKPRQVLPIEGKWRAVVAGPGWEKPAGEDPPGKKSRPINFMNRLEKLRVFGQLLFLAIAGASAVLPCAGGQGHFALRQPPAPPPSQAYLLVVGPPDLRFASGNAHDNIAPTRFYPAETNLAKIEIPLGGSAVQPEKNIPMPTNAAPPVAVVMQADSTPPPTSLPPINFAPGGTDPSIVTPDMLVGFLQPSSPGKINNSRNNSPAVVMPMNLGFTPPAAVPAPGNSSRAVYKSE